MVGIRGISCKALYRKIVETECISNIHGKPQDLGVSDRKCLIAASNLTQEQRPSGVMGPPVKSAEHLPVFGNVSTWAVETVSLDTAL